MNVHDTSLPNTVSSLDTEAFLNAIAPGETEFTFQTFDDKKDGHRSNLAHVLHGTLDEHWSTLCDLSSMGAGIFVTVNRTNLKGRSKENIIGVRALCVDLDGADPMNIERLSLKVSCGAETSPGRYHFYWPVKGVLLEEFPFLQKRLAVLMGGDASVCDLPRVMRLPGFPHQKREPFMVYTLLSNDPFVYDRDKFVAALEDAERLHGVVPVSNVTSSKSANPEIAPTSAQRVYTCEEEKNLQSALAHIPSDDRPTWFKIGAALHATGWREKARSLWDEWSRKSTKFDSDDQEKTWDGFDRYEGTPVSVATIFHLAREHGWQELTGLPPSAVAACLKQLHHRRPMMSRCFGASRRCLLSTTNEFGLTRRTNSASASASWTKRF